jgi:predicted transcriptional regulator of viral defense system
MASKQAKNLSCQVSKSPTPNNIMTPNSISTSPYWSYWVRQSQTSDRQVPVSILIATYVKEGEREIESQNYNVNHEKIWVPNFTPINLFLFQLWAFLFNHR